MISNFASLFIIFIHQKKFSQEKRKKGIPFLASYIINNLKSCLFCEAIFVGTAIMQGKGHNGCCIAESLNINPNAKVFNV